MLQAPWITKLRYQTFVHSRLATVVVASVLRGMVVLVALATTVSEGSTSIGFIVVVPTLVVAIAGSCVLRLFTDS